MDKTEHKWIEVAASTYGPLYECKKCGITLFPAMFHLTTKCVSHRSTQEQLDHYGTNTKLEDQQNDKT